MLCEECGQNQATIHIATIIGGQKKDEHLCPQCWQKRNAKILGGLNVGSLLAQLLGAQAQQAEDQGLACDACGLSFAEFQKTGRLGCAHCYAAFGENMKKTLGSIHGHTRHVGKVPPELEKEALARRRIDDLRREMDEAVRVEDFERAAALRDEIRSLDAARSGEEEA